MADKTIGDLTQAASIGNEDLFVLQQNGEAKKLKGAQLVKYAQDAVGAQVTAATQAAESAEMAKTGAESAQTQAQAARDAILNMIVEAITLEAGAAATVEKSLVDAVYKLTFGLPRGEKGATGATGPANTLAIGTVTKGTEAAATITGSAPNQTLNLVLPKGDKGDKGATGETGATGNGIASISLKSGTHAAGTTDTYEITFTDGTTFDFLVYNGANGTGAGDMTQAVYDPQGKAQDIFAYADGKSAYQSAVEAGYTGTETAFNAALSVVPTHIENSDIHVTAEEKAAWSESDVFIAEYGTTTNAEIEAAYQAGKPIIAIYPGKAFQYHIFQRANSNSHKFSTFALNGKFFTIQCVNDVWSDGQNSGVKPSSHASTHATGGTDPITPASIGAAAEPVTATALPDSGTALTDNTIYNVGSAVSTYQFAPPASGWAHGKFTTDATVAITFSSGSFVGSVPAFEASKTYEFDVLNGVWAFVEVVSA